MSPAREQRRDDVFDLLVSHPEGMTVHELADALGTNRRNADRAIHDLREYLGFWDDVNVPADNVEPGKPWKYRIAGDLDSIRPWCANRLADAETRIGTIQSMVASIVSATDGRSIEGRKARLIDRYLTRLVEDMELLVESTDPHQ